MTSTRNPPGGAILNLMSSWRSHLPPEMNYSRVAGLGMNAEEMRDNPQLTDFIVHSLNAQPKLPYADQTFDAACCCVSVQYLQKPFDVLPKCGACSSPMRRAKSLTDVDSYRKPP